MVHADVDRARGERRYPREGYEQQRVHYRSGHGDDSAKLDQRRV